MWGHLQPVAMLSARRQHLLRIVRCLLFQCLKWQQLNHRSRALRSRLMAFFDRISQQPSIGSLTPERRPAANNSRLSIQRVTAINAVSETMLEQGKDSRDLALSLPNFRCIPNGALLASINIAHEGGMVAQT